VHDLIGRFLLHSIPFIVLSLNWSEDFGWLLVGEGSLMRTLSMCVIIEHSIAFLFCAVELLGV
jgi:hypothetical protein